MTPVKRHCSYEAMCRQLRLVVVHREKTGYYSTSIQSDEPGVPLTTPRHGDALD